MKFFANDYNQLCLLMENFPKVIIRTCTREPVKSIVSKVKAWEKKLFSKLDPLEAGRWRESKWMQISDTKEEDIDQQIQLIQIAIKREEETANNEQKMIKIQENRDNLLTSLRDCLQKKVVKPDKLKELAELPPEDGEQLDGPIINQC
eukprot:TRINITY_DN6224_c0_g1_i1.p2 TRINITY_DN6224_c0_g1~~TRINITY_DN6224_c0_g1_i1.p2  ORF type:complete len:148 (-),score=39.47 TRINITY_DN6224_c0_g1_i1:294-737(-)